eukprot:UN02503
MKNAIAKPKKNSVKDLLNSIKTSTNDKNKNNNKKKHKAKSDINLNKSAEKNYSKNTISSSSKKVNLNRKLKDMAVTIKKFADKKTPRTSEKNNTKNRSLSLPGKNLKMENTKKQKTKSNSLMKIAEPKVKQNDDPRSALISPVQVKSSIEVSIQKAEVQVRSSIEVKHAQSEETIKITDTDIVVMTKCEMREESAEMIIEEENVSMKVITSDQKMVIEETMVVEDCFNDTLNIPDDEVLDKMIEDCTTNLSDDDEIVDKMDEESMNDISVAEESMNDDCRLEVIGKAMQISEMIIENNVDENENNENHRACLIDILLGIQLSEKTDQKLAVEAPRKRKKSITMIIDEYKTLLEKKKIELICDKNKDHEKTIEPNSEDKQMDSMIVEKDSAETSVTDAAPIPAGENLQKMEIEEEEKSECTESSYQTVQNSTELTSLTPARNKDILKTMRDRSVRTSERKRSGNRRRQKMMDFIGVT